MKECSSVHLVTLLDGRDSWRALLASLERIWVSICVCAGGFFTVSTEFLAMLTSKPWEGLSRIPSHYHFISLFGNQAIYLGPLCVFSCNCGIE